MSYKKLTAALLLITVLQINACGYFLYPERVGQTTGKIDPAIFILDAAGLLLGILPGVVAFAVDITTGAIYLPAGGKSTIEKHRKRISSMSGQALLTVDIKDMGLDRQAIAETLSQALGRSISAEQIQFYQPEQSNSLPGAYRRVALVGRR